MIQQHLNIMCVIKASMIYLWIHQVKIRQQVFTRYKVSVWNIDLKERMWCIKNALWQFIQRERKSPPWKMEIRKKSLVLSEWHFLDWLHRQKTTKNSEDSPDRNTGGRGFALHCLLTWTIYAARRVYVSRGSEWHIAEHLVCIMLHSLWSTRTNILIRATWSGWELVISHNTDENSAPCV